MLKKVIMILIFLVLVPSCQMFLVDSSEWKEPSAKKGYADYYPNFDLELFDRNKVLKQIGKYNVMLPEKTNFIYGKTIHGTDRIFGKKRKYFYDEKSKLGSEIYLIEDTFEEISKVYSNINIYSEKNGRYKVSIPGSPGLGILIRIKPKLYLVCKSRDVKEWNTYTAKLDCEELVKIMKQ